MTKTKKRTVIVKSRHGAHVPAWGRLGPGTHDAELDDAQIASLEQQGCDVLTAAEYKKQKQEK